MISPSELPVTKPNIRLKTSAAVELLWRNGFTRREIEQILVLSPWSVKFHLQQGGWLPRFSKGRVPLGLPRAKGRPVTMPEELAVLARRYERANPR
jgi:hypothetical protein